MTPNEIARVQDYLRTVLDNNHIVITPPARAGGPVELSIAGEFFGVLHRDDDEGEISYSLNISILEEDLPPASAVGGG